MTRKLTSKTRSSNIRTIIRLQKQNCSRLLWNEAAHTEVDRLIEQQEIDGSEEHFDHLFTKAKDISTDCYDEILKRISYCYDKLFHNRCNHFDLFDYSDVDRDLAIEKLKPIMERHKRAIRLFRTLKERKYEIIHLGSLVALYCSMDLPDQVITTCEDIFRIRGSALMLHPGSFWSNILFRMGYAGHISEILSLMKRSTELDPSQVFNNAFLSVIDTIAFGARKTGFPFIASLTELKERSELGFLSDADYYALNGKVQESQGNPTQAASFYLRSIENGVKDIFVYERCIILLKKQKGIEEALRIADLAVKCISKNGLSYSLEEQLLHRKARLLTRTKKVPHPLFIPCFKVKGGNTNIQPIKQEKLPHPLTRLVTVEDGAGAVAQIGMKEPVISAFDTHAQTIWSTKVPLSMMSERSASYRNYYNHGLQANDHGIVYWHMAGRVGDGYSKLLFLSVDGEIRSQQRLPDKISEVRVSGDNVAVGCRDGHLRVYDFSGKLNWEYVFKQKRSLSPIFRECPYHVLAPQNGTRIACTSYSDLYVFDNQGELLWKWKPPRQATTATKFSITSDGLTDLEHYYSILGLSSEASLEQIKKAFRKKVFETHPDINLGLPKSAADFCQVYEAYQALCEQTIDPEILAGVSEEISVETDSSSAMINGVFSADGNSITIYDSQGNVSCIDGNGETIEKRKLNCHVGCFVAREDASILATTDNGHAYFYGQSGLMSLNPIHCWVQGHIKNDANELVAFWGLFPTKRLMLFSYDGTLVTDIEMARPVRAAAFLGNSILVGTQEELLILSAFHGKQITH